MSNVRGERSEVKGQSLTGDGFSLSLSLAFLRLLFSLFFPAPAAVEAAEDEEEGRGLTVLLDFLYRASAGASNWGRVEGGGREGGKGMGGGREGGMGGGKGMGVTTLYIYLYCC